MFPFRALGLSLLLAGIVSGSLTLIVLGLQLLDQYPVW